MVISGKYYKNNEFWPFNRFPADFFQIHKKLCLGNLNDEKADKLLLNLGKCVNIKSLEIENSRFKCQNVVLQLQMKKFENLKIFSIKNCFFSSECVYHLVKNINVENFEVLCLKNVELNEYKTKISIKKFKNLRVLFLNDGSFELIENFCDLAELKYLEALSIRNNKISSLKSFFENLDSKLFLTYLDISFIDFSNECVAALKEFLR